MIEQYNARGYEMVPLGDSYQRQYFAVNVDAASRDEALALVAKMLAGRNCTIEACWRDRPTLSQRFFDFMSGKWGWVYVAAIILSLVFGASGGGGDPWEGMGWRGR